MGPVPPVNRDHPCTSEQKVVLSHTDELEAAEVSMLDPDIVNAIRRLKALGHGTRSIAKLLELDRLAAPCAR